MWSVKSIGIVSAYYWEYQNWYELGTSESKVVLITTHDTLMYFDSWQMEFCYGKLGIQGYPHRKMNKSNHIGHTESRR